MFVEVVRYVTPADEADTETTEEDKFCSVELTPVLTPSPKISLNDIGSKLKGSSSTTSLLSRLVFNPNPAKSKGVTKLVRRAGVVVGG